MKQLKFFKSSERAYGGSLLKTRKGRAQGRPLDTKNTMHLVLRSTLAKGAWSFRRGDNSTKVRRIVQKFATKYGVQVISLANVGNHLHFQIKLANRYTYRPFIRAITASIAMAITGMSRWNKLDIKFWDLRPFTRVVVGWRAFLTLSDYIRINKFEGFGYSRSDARMLVSASREWRNANSG